MVLRRNSLAHELSPTQDSIKASFNCVPTGSWYYGTVSLEDVVNLLDAALEAEVLTLKSSMEG